MMLLRRRWPKVEREKKKIKKIWRNVYYRTRKLEEFIQEPEIRARKPKMCILQI
jgi:hypothetical protein